MNAEVTLQSGADDRIGHLDQRLLGTETVLRPTKFSA
jgi:hypothetical protein